MLTLGRSKEYRTRTNTEVAQEGEDAGDRPGYVWDTYKPTPVMSTYLVAWLVSKYESAKSTSARGVKFEAFYNNASQMQHAADVGAKMLDHFEQKVFGINYNLPKMDIVAAPKFEFGAMENWGMMIFQDYLVARKGQNANWIFTMDGVMAHELVFIPFHYCETQPSNRPLQCIG